MLGPENQFQKSNMSNRVSTTEHLLSNQEGKIAKLLAWGFIQKEIADRLKIKQQTVSVHLRNIYRKLGIHKETDLCRWEIFYEYGIADNPFKKMVAILFLTLSISSIALESTSLLRMFKSETSRTSRSETFKPAKVRRCRNTFELSYLTA